MYKVLTYKGGYILPHRILVTCHTMKQREIFETKWNLVP